jgi:hypothetical protein
MRVQLGKRELEIRADAFTAAECVIVNAGRSGGIDAPDIRTVQNGNLSDKFKMTRVDIEIILGTAFI